MVTEFPPRPDTGNRWTVGRIVAVFVLALALIAQVLLFLGYVFVLLLEGTTALEFGVFVLVTAGVGWGLLWLLIAMVRERVAPIRALLVLVALVADVLIVVVLTTGTIGGSCSERERAIINEITQYPGASTFRYEPASGACTTSLEVEAPPQEVLAHYRKELQDDGWTVSITDVPTESEGEPVTAKDLTAQRGTDSFSIALESFAGQTSAAIRVDAG